MKDAREDIKIRSLDSFLMILILSFGLLIWHNSENPPARTGHLVTMELSVSSNEAVLSSETVFQAFNKAIFSQSEKPSQLSAAGIQILENRRTEQIIAILQDARRNTENNSLINFRYLLFPSERDDLPPLS